MRSRIKHSSFVVVNAYFRQQMNGESTCAKIFLSCKQRSSLCFAFTRRLSIVFSAYILPVVHRFTAYTSPKPPRPSFLYCLKSSIVNGRVWMHRNLR